MQYGEIAAEECSLFLHDVLLEQRRDLVTKQSLVILPDLPLHLHCANFIQLLISHHLLQLLLRHLRKQDERNEMKAADVNSVNASKLKCRPVNLSPLVSVS